MSTQITVNKSASGVWGISDTSGNYTFYTTLTLAMAAATAGQTIELFADVTETGNVTVTLKNGVNINGNGHTYTLSVANASPALITADSSVVDIGIFNITIKRTNSTTNAGTCFSTGINSDGRINFNGSTLINTGAGHGIGYVSYNGNVSIYNAYAVANSGAAIIVNSNSTTCKIVNCTGVSSSNAGIYAQAFCDIVNCIGESTSSAGIIALSNTCSNSIGRSVSGTGIQSNGASITNSTGISSSSYGMFGNNAGYFVDCVASSSANYGMYLYNSESFVVKKCYIGSSSSIALYFSGSIGAHKIDVWDTHAVSSANYAFGTGNGSMVLHNCTAETTASACVSAKNSMYNCVARCKWNNAGGHAVVVNDTNQFDITNCSLIVTNASANALYRATATTINYANNAFKGATTPVNANITQGIVNTHDNQGNILI